MNINDVYYHGIRHQVRRVLGAMTDDEIDRGLEAFENGASNWSHCFFARALNMDAHSSDWNKAHDPAWPRVEAPTIWIRDRLKLQSHVPVRIVWHLFDGIGEKFSTMTRDQLRQFVSDVRDERRPEEVMNLLRAVGEIDESRPVVYACV